MFQVSRGSFLPAPNVDSAVIRLDLQKPPSLDFDEPVFFRVVRAGFAQRRKTLVNSLAGTLGLDKNAVAAALADCGIKPTTRAEELQMEQFLTLARQLSFVL